jgi:hypothetical protein
MKAKSCSEILMLSIENTQCHLTAYGSNSETSISFRALGVRVGVIFWWYPIDRETNLSINAYKKELEHSIHHALEV